MISILSCLYYFPDVWSLFIKDLRTALFTLDINRINICSHWFLTFCTFIHFYRLKIVCNLFFLINFVFGFFIQLLSTGWYILYRSQPTLTHRGSWYVSTTGKCIPTMFASPDARTYAFYSRIMTIGAYMFFSLASLKATNPSPNFDAVSGAILTR